MSVCFSRHNTGGKGVMMGRVYRSESELPDNPNRVGDEDYGRKWWLDELYEDEDEQDDEEPFPIA